MSTFHFGVYVQFPYVVEPLSNDQLETWNVYYAGRHDRDRRTEEGIWRRTQAPENAEQSGWSEGSGHRRRIVHYRYGYDVVDAVLQMNSFYLYHCSTYPIAEIDNHEMRLRGDLTAGGWSLDDGVWRRGDLECRVTRFEVHPEDAAVDRQVPADFHSLEAVLTSRGHDPATEIRHLPWHVLNGGMRVKDSPGNPTVVPDLRLLAEHLPFQVEVGCGTSVEAGIPPLHRLHEIYRVTGRHDSRPGAKDPFILDSDSDTLLAEVIRRPEDKFVEFTEMLRICLGAAPTPALQVLRRLADAGYLVGPVITNNFDVLCARAGLDECFVRRYDQKIPDIKLLSQARALLVIGNHADRRKVETRARECGMAVFFLDPEGFWVDGEFAPYPLEGPQTADYLCRSSADQGLRDLEKLLSGVKL